MKVIYRDLALADLEQIATYLQERSPAGARGVLQAIRDAVRDIAFNPEGARRTADPAVRLKVVTRYGSRFITLWQLRPSRSCMCGTVRAGLGSQKNLSDSRGEKSVTPAAPTPKTS